LEAGAKAWARGGKLGRPLICLGLATPAALDGRFLQSSYGLGEKPLRFKPLKGLRSKTLAVTGTGTGFEAGHATRRPTRASGGSIRSGDIA
jgi:hypothetical protein